MLSHTCVIVRAVTSRLVQPRKPSGKLGGGLGVKKLDTKVDETLFEQAPAAPEPPKPAPVAAEAAAAAEAAPSGSSRFAYDTLTAAPASTGAGSGGGAAGGGAAAQRGKDGHLTLGELQCSMVEAADGLLAPGCGCSSLGRVHAAQASSTLSKPALLARPCRVCKASAPVRGLLQLPHLHP